MTSFNKSHINISFDAKNNGFRTNAVCNQTIFETKPDDVCIDNEMKLTQTNIITIAIYSIIFVISSIANITLMAILVKKRGKEISRINRFMFHLNVADLIITFVTIPLEIGWKSTVDWRIGDFGCRFFQFMRPFGIYLTSFIIISLLIDR